MRRRVLRVLLAVPVLFAAVWFLFPFPTEQLERLHESPRVTDRSGRPLLVLTGADGQWRVPVPLSRISPWLRAATVAVEDRRFESHLGVDPLAMGRAGVQNLRSRRVISGASTITMQLCRMLSPRPRNLPSKAIESFRALQLDALLSKDEILEHYLNLAPYGGNLRGAEAASRVWFGRSAADLTLPEAALLAGLPQSPVRHRPDTNPTSALARRNEVLRCMRKEGMIDGPTHDAAVSAPLSVRPLAGIARKLGVTDARHAAWWALSRRPAGGRTTIDLSLQGVVEAAVAEHAATLPEGTDVAVVVIDVATGGIRALVGSADFDDPADGQVNGALALRSPGSALKPFLYAAAFGTGRLGPDTVIPDRPIDRGGWRPRNFEPGFAGEVTAAEALTSSLNVPALLVTEATGLSRCAGVLRSAGVPLSDRAVARGGLAVATGAVEVRLTDLTNAYATLARRGAFRTARIFPDDPVTERRALPAGVCAVLDDILGSHRRRPGSKWFMWKTGTSSGRRDAWAVGHNGRFAIGVWAGRFSGAADYNFIGAHAAEPLLSRLFSDPLVATEDVPAKPAALPVTHPFFQGPPDTAPRILSPRDGARFLAAAGRAPVPLQAMGAAGTWFLDGEVVRGDRLELPPGRYEVLLVCSRGESDRVRFTIEK